MATFVFNPLLERELAISPEMAAMLEIRVKRAEDVARQIAPVGEDNDPHPGQFRDSIHGEVGMADGILIGRLVSDDEDAPFIIFGTSDTPPHDTLVRAVEGSAAE